MEIVFLKSDVESTSDLAWVEAAVIKFLARLNPAVGVALTDPATWQTQPEKIDVINLTEQKRKAGASGYHVYLNGEAIAYCSPNAAHFGLAGLYKPAVYSKPIYSLGKIKTPSKLRTPAELFPGLITTVCHEIAECLADRDVATYTAPDPKTGIKWLLEPCDWVYGSYYAETVNDLPAVFPNVALPSFSTPGGKAPFDLLGIVPAPFTPRATSGAYGYGLVNGVLTKIF